MSSDETAGGFVPVLRAWLDPDHDLHPHARGEDMTALTAWLDLLAMARWADGEDAKRGEVPNVAERFLARRWRWTRGRVRRLLTSLEREGRIVRARDGDGRTPGSVTIVGYDDLTTGSTRPANRPANDQAPGPQEAQRDAGFRDSPARKVDGTRPAPRPKVVEGKEGTTTSSPGCARAETDLGRAVLAFFDRVGAEWALKTDPDTWADRLDYQAVNYGRELHRAGDYIEEQQKKEPKKVPSSFTRFLHNWFSIAEKRATANGDNGADFAAQSESLFARANR